MGIFRVSVELQELNAIRVESIIAKKVNMPIIGNPTHHTTVSFCNLTYDVLEVGEHNFRLPNQPISILNKFQYNERILNKRWNGITTVGRYLTDIQLKALQEICHGIDVVFVLQEMMDVMAEMGLSDEDYPGIVSPILNKGDNIVTVVHA